MNRAWKIPIKKWVGCIGECVLVEQVYGGGILIGLDHRVDITELSALAKFPIWIFNLGHTKSCFIWKWEKKSLKIEKLLFSGENRLPLRF